MKNARLEELGRDPGWKGALTIFERFAEDGRIWSRVDLDRQSIDFRKILDDVTFSGGELRMLRIAASLFNQDFDINLHKALSNLDERATATVLLAIQGF